MLRLSPFTRIYEINWESPEIQDLGANMHIAHSLLKRCHITFCLVLY